MIEAFRAPSEVVDRLNRTVRALARAEDGGHWKEILLDGVGAYCARCVLLRAGTIEIGFEGSRGIASTSPFTVLRTEAPAITEALNSRETVVAACIAGELSSAIVRLFDGAARVLIVPIVDSTGPFAAIVADGVGETSGIELIATVAGLTRPRDLAELVTIQPRPAHQGTATVRERPLDLRAQRFARVKVAEMQLHHASAVKTGRASCNLFQSLRPYIESARETYLSRYLEKSLVNADYLHVELVRTLANNDETILGAEYPGPLV